MSDRFEKNDGILYIRDNLCELFFNVEKSKISACDKRVALEINFDRELLRPIFEDLCDKIADVIAIGYKYDFFSDKIKCVGLGENHRELLITALIAADLQEDKRYIRARIKKCTLQSSGEKDFCLAIDGFYNFRLIALKNKWAEVAEYVPAYFSLRELSDFIAYLSCEKNGKRVIIDGQKVYDARYNRLRRSSLLGCNREKNGYCKGDSATIRDEGEKRELYDSKKPSESKEVSGVGDVIKETILSGAGEIEVKSAPSERDEKLLREYFGDKVFFS